MISYCVGKYVCDLYYSPSYFVYITLFDRTNNLSHKPDSSPPLIYNNTVTHSSKSLSVMASLFILQTLHCRHFVNDFNPFVLVSRSTKEAEHLTSRSDHIKKDPKNGFLFGLFL